VDERDGAGESPHPAQPGGKTGPQPKASQSEVFLAAAAIPGVAATPRMAVGTGCRGVPEDDFDGDAEMARWVADVEAGRERIPEEWELDGSAVSLSLGDACDLDPALLAAMLGPDGLGGQSLSLAFGQDQAANALLTSLCTRRAAAGRVGRAVAALREAPG
jgi:hypothetical protein